MDKKSTHEILLEDALEDLKGKIPSKYCLILEEFIVSYRGRYSSFSMRPFPTSPSLSRALSNAIQNPLSLSSLTIKRSDTRLITIASPSILSVLWSIWIALSSLDWRTSRMPLSY